MCSYIIVDGHMSLVCTCMEKISLKDTIRADEEMAFRFWACVVKLEGKNRLQVANLAASAVE
jgi:hypothetical protein